MSTGKPATLDGSLLARKGDAAPAISNNSPLLEELGEPRTEQPNGPLGAGNVVASKPNSFLGSIGLALNWFAKHPAFGVLGLAIGIAILFGVTIAALSPPQEVVSKPILPEQAASNTAPETIVLPTDGDAMTRAPEKLPEIIAKAPEPKPAVTPPKLPVAVAPAPPPVPKAKVAVAKPESKPVATPKPSGKPGRFLLQLSAVPTAKSARSELTRLEKRLGSILGNRKIVVVKAVPPGKPPVYRLRASAYDTRAAAISACKRIKQRRMACIVIKR